MQKALIKKSGFESQISELKEFFTKEKLEIVHLPTIWDKIKLLRNKQGLTQDELARKPDLLYKTLTKIETIVIAKLTYPNGYEDY